MTTRPGKMAEDMLRYHRTKHLAQCVSLTAKDGAVIRITDHDRDITLDNQTFTSVTLGSMSADRREAALRAGDQEVRGIIDGSTITLTRLEGLQYEGAKVVVQIVDWARPYIVYSKFVRRAAGINWDGTAFVGRLEGMSQQLQKPVGGQFGGTFTTTCQYELGGPFCTKDLSTFTVSAGAVGTVVDAHTKLRFTTASFNPTAGGQDDFYRDGSIKWLTGNNVGHVSAIVGFTWSTRECELLIPTPRDIQVGDTAVVKPGCDGVFSTCRTKYSNQANFGGDNLQPTASDLRRPVVDA